MLPVHRDLLLRQLARQPLRGHGIAQEEVPGVLIIHEIARRVGVGKRPAVLHRLAVVGGIFDDLDPAAAEQVLLPLLGVGRHVHDDPKADRRAHDPDAHAQVAGRADLDRVAAEYLAGRRLRQLPVGRIFRRAVRRFLRRQDAVRKRQILGML